MIVKSDLYHIANKVLSNRISMYVPCSKSAAQEFTDRFHVKSTKICTIPNGVDVKKIRNSVSVTDEHKGVIALSVGRFTNQKNFSVTANAFSKIHSDEFTYKIYGNGSEENLIKQNISSSRVKVNSPVTRQEILNQLGGCDIVVMPSLWEGLSIFMLEAIALGCPMMVSDVPSLRGVFNENALKDKETWRRCSWGYLVRTNDTNAYYEAMNDFLNNRYLSVQMKKKVESISAKYDIKETAHEYLQLYTKLVIHEGR